MEERPGELVMKNSGIKIRTLIVISFVFIALFVVSLVCGVLFLQITNYSQDATIGINEKVATGLEKELNLKRMTASDFLSAALEQCYGIDYKNEDQAKNKLKNNFKILKSSNRNIIRSISLFKSNGELMVSSEDKQLRENSNLLNQPWYIDVNSIEKPYVFTKPHIQSVFDENASDKKWVVTALCPVDWMPGEGILTVDINFDVCKTEVDNSSYIKGSYSYLVDSKGDLIYHHKYQQIKFSEELENTKLPDLNKPDGSYFINIDGEKDLMTIRTLEGTDWRIVCVCPIYYMGEQYQSIIQIFVFIFIIAIIIVLISSVIVASYISEPIDVLETSVKRIEKGYIDTKIPANGFYEVKNLGKAIESMVDQMEGLMETIVWEQAQKRTAELDVLQNQINPHFLYNTLDSIIWMIENDNTKDAITMVTSLAKLFRISLSNGENIISINSEISHAKNYMTIQQMRFKNKFVCTFDIEEEARSMETIKLIVQPLLENAIYHGVKYLDGDGKINVKAYCRDESLFIDVVDNGIGIPKEECEKLLSRDDQGFGKKTGIGLRNVDERIRLTYGKKYGLFIISEPDEGTTVRIHLPKKRFEEKNE